MDENDKTKEEQERQDRMNKLAEEVLRLSRDTLMMNLRFLDAALSMFTLYPIDESSLFTDGKYLLYNARHVLDRYKTEQESTVRDYLHVVMHCVFRHMFMDPALDRPIWDLAADIAVESVISELNIKSTASKRQTVQQDALRRLQDAVGGLTAERLYHYFKSNRVPPVELAKLRGLFYADNHEIWYMTDEEKHNRFGLPLPGGGNDSDLSDGEEKYAAVAELSDQWKKISERMQMDMEAFSKHRDTAAGNLTQNLKEINREKYDYTAFLKKFSVMGEVMKINDDEFDYVYYTYGLQLYENLPLIEPLEYKDVKRIREFVIAIDTSGSVKGDEVQSFLQKTYNIMKSSESFFTKINLHIVQCDAVVQEHVKITSQEEFDHYLDHMKLHGFGGTDFRPVFSLVNRLIEAKEFTNLKGLIYFTDGYGVFPEKKPPYETAFVFVRDGYDPPEVPPWAIKLVLQKEEI